MTARPLPESHELLAIQSYLLQSTYNVLPEYVDPSQPVDANVVCGFSGSNRQLGAAGSEDEKAWMDEIEHERSDEVVVWYGGDGTVQLPHSLLDTMTEIHGSHRHATLIPCHNRPDLPLLRQIFDRLKLPLSTSPIVMIGNKPIVATDETISELRGSGKLREMLKEVGWVKDEKKGRKSGWKPKLAKLVKKELNEVEIALQAA